MHSSTLRVSAVILGAFFVVSATSAKAIPMGPLPIPPDAKAVANGGASASAMGRITDAD